MPEVATHEETLKIRERLRAGKSVRRRLQRDGELYIDRPLPYLCLHRQTEDPRDTMTHRLVTSQPSYLIGSADTEHHDELKMVVSAVAEAMAERFGRFLLLEIWSEPDTGEEEEVEPPNLQPYFTIAALNSDMLAPATNRLAEALRDVRVHNLEAEVECVNTNSPSPPELEPVGPLLPPGALVVGIEVKPVYRHWETDEVYPFLFNELRLQLAVAIKKAAFEFSRRCTTYVAPNYLALGRRALEQAVSKVDQGLSRIDDSFEFLLLTTPVNAAEALADFQKSEFQKDPVFAYRPLPVDPELLKRRLFDLPIEEVEDPVLGWLFREKQEELDRKITMLRDRDTRRFFFGSVQLYGEVRPALLGLAEDMLERLPRHDYELTSAETLDAQAVAELAAGEFLHYRETLEAFPRTVQIRHDMPPGMMVSRGELLIGSDTRTPARRIEALLQHEVGTHMLTYYNGRAQPLRVLYNGLAGYEALQEGVAVLSEYLVGGLNVPRLRVLAARVVAAHSLIEGASFVEVFQRLQSEYDFELREAFSIAMRTFRGGGLIKDVVYLRGLHELFEYICEGGQLEPLFVGKIALHHLPVIKELEDRGILAPVPLRPRYMDRKDTPGRLEKIRSGLTLVELLDKRRE